jgi:hypothetical protein
MRWFRWLFWWRDAGLVQKPPPDLVYLKVPAEMRIFMVEIEIRSLKVPAEMRSFVLEPVARVFRVPGVGRQFDAGE